MTSPDGAYRQTGAALVAAILLLCAVALWPIFVIGEMGLQDYPNHLARAFILLHQQDPLLRANYRLEWSPIPDLGWDLWVLSVGRLLPLVATAKLFVVLAFAMGASGCFVLGRVIVGRWTAMPMLALPFLFNSAYTKGFLSFDMGLAVSLWAMAWWLWMPDRRWLMRLAGATVLATLLYVLHICAFAIYGLFVLGIEAQTLVRGAEGLPLGRRILRFTLNAAQALVAVALFVLARSMTPGADTPSDPVTLEEPLKRLQHLDFLIDVGSPAWGALFVIIMAITILVLIATGRVRFETRAIGPLLLLVLAFFVLPRSLLGGLNIAGRLTVPAVLIAIASLRPRPGHGRSTPAVSFSVAVAVILAITALQSRNWRATERDRRDFLASIDQMPDGSKLFWAHAGMSARALRAEAIGSYHVGSYAVLAKRALVQSMFVSPGQQPLRFRDAAIQGAPANSETFLDAIVGFEGARLNGYLSRFDYVLLHGPEGDVEKTELPFDHLRAVGMVGQFRLYKVIAD